MFAPVYCGAIPQYHLFSCWRFTSNVNLHLPSSMGSRSALSFSQTRPDARLALPTVPESDVMRWSATTARSCCSASVQYPTPLYWEPTQYPTFPREESSELGCTDMMPTGFVPAATAYVLPFLLVSQRWTFARKSVAVGLTSSAMDRSLRNWVSAQSIAASCVASSRVTVRKVVVLMLLFANASVTFRLSWDGKRWRRVDCSAVFVLRGVCR